MSRLLDNIRNLRDAVVPVISECGEMGANAPKLSVGARKAKKKPKKSGILKKKYDSWMADVEEAVEDICGMGLDILDGTPWRKMFMQGLDPREAAETALREAEEEDEDDEDDFIQEEKEEPPRSLRRRSFAGGSDNDLDPINALMREFVDVIRPVKTGQPKARQPIVERVDRQERWLPENTVPSKFLMQKGSVPPSSSVQFGNDPNSGAFIKGGNNVYAYPLGQKQDAMAAALSSIQGVVAEERARKEEFRRQQQRQQEMDEAAREAAKAQEQNDGDQAEEDDADEHNAEAYNVSDAKKGIDEASVMGGDFGRWGPATSAAGSGGRALAAAISKATGKKYKFVSEGNPQSEEGGTVLWFLIEPEKSSNENYYLGIKIKGDKGDPTWDVLLKRGKGLGSATSVTSQRGVKTAELKGAVGKLKNNLPKGNSQPE